MCSSGKKRTSIQYLLRIGAQGSQLRNRHCAQEAVKNVGDDFCSRKYRMFDLFEVRKRYSTRASQKREVYLSQIKNVLR